MKFSNATIWLTSLFSLAVVAGENGSTDPKPFAVDQRCIVLVNGISSFFLGEEFVSKTAQRSCVVESYREYLRSNEDSTYTASSQRDIEFRQTDKALNEQSNSLPHLNIDIINDSVKNGAIDIATTAYQKKSTGSRSDQDRTPPGFETLSPER